MLLSILQGFAFMLLFVTLLSVVLFLVFHDGPGALATREHFKILLSITVLVMVVGGLVAVAATPVRGPTVLDWFAGEEAQVECETSFAFGTGPYALSYETFTE